MKTPSQTLFSLAGSPPQKGVFESPSVCILACVRWTPRQAPIQEALPMSAKAKLGKAINEENERPPNLRLFWHAFDDDGYVFGTKGHKPRLREWMRKSKRGAWWCCVPDTGQKHTLPWARVNAITLLLCASARRAHSLPLVREPHLAQPFDDVVH